MEAKILRHSLKHHVRAVEQCAAQVGRQRIGGLRIKSRAYGERLDAELLSFAATRPCEERVLVLRDPGGTALLLEALPDLAAKLCDLGRPHDAD